MTDLRTAAEQLLTALDEWREKGGPIWQCDPSITALRAALAEQCQCGDRPAAQCHGEWEPGCDLGNNPKYAKPLTDEEIKACEKQAMADGALPFEQRLLFARAIERAHGIGTEARATLSSPRGSLGEEA